jgi:hypothetical protein
MSQPTPRQVAAAKSLGIDPSFGEAPVNILKLAELLADLKERVEQLENGGRKWGRR